MKPENEAEANVIKSVLAEHGIYAEIKSFHDTAYDGLFQAQYGWGLIRVCGEGPSPKRRGSSRNGAMPLLTNSPGKSRTYLKKIESPLAAL
jgi:hypothetical protein